MLKELHSVYNIQTAARACTCTSNSNTADFDWKLGNNMHTYTCNNKYTQVESLSTQSAVSFNVIQADSRTHIHHIERGRRREGERERERGRERGGRERERGERGREREGGGREREREEKRDPERYVASYSFAHTRIKLTLIQQSNEARSRHNIFTTEPPQLPNYTR